MILSASQTVYGLTQLQQDLKAWGVSPDILTQRNLPIFIEAHDLVVAETSTRGRDFKLIPEASLAWKNMRESAEKAGLHLYLISAFRSIEYQHQLINQRIMRGEPTDKVLSLLAPPSCSEHHTGRAIDIGTHLCPPISETFAHTPAFKWLTQHAAKYQFSLSYPKNNPYQFVYEPWHWCWHSSP
jgi:D-alanyl-D-alanine carboxypeptidase